DAERGGRRVATAGGTRRRETGRAGRDGQHGPTAVGCWRIGIGDDAGDRSIAAGRINAVVHDPLGGDAVGGAHVLDADQLAGFAGRQRVGHDVELVDRAEELV